MEENLLRFVQLEGKETIRIKDVQVAPADGEASGQH